MEGRTPGKFFSNFAASCTWFSKQNYTTRWHSKISKVQGVVLQVCLIARDGTISAGFKEALCNVGGLKCGVFQKGGGFFIIIISLLQGTVV